MTQQQGSVREAVGVFETVTDLDAAVSALEAADFRRRDISVLDRGKDVEHRFTGARQETRKFEDDPSAPRTVLMRPLDNVMSAGFFMAHGIYIGVILGALGMVGKAPFMMGVMIAGAGGVLGGLLGLAVAWIVHKRYKHMLRDQTTHGGVPLWVRTFGPREEKLAQKIMLEHGGKDVHAHSIKGVHVPDAR